jgi:hypothetical protein
VTAADPVAAYYQAVEEYFVARRGDPLFLSNADWQLIRRWRRAGTPLRVVLRGISDALESHTLSWSRASKVGSLAYCAAEVDAARERWERALQLGTEPGVDAAGALAGLAAALEGAHGLDEESRAIAQETANELREEPAEPPDLRKTEARLARCEARLLAVLRRHAEAGDLAALESAVDAELAPYRERMPAPVLAQIRADALARRLLEAHGLPRLSLFHL